MNAKTIRLLFYSLLLIINLSIGIYAKASTSIPTVTLSVLDDKTTEYWGGAAVWLVTRTGGDLSQSLTVSYTFSGTAVLGVNYAVSNGTVEGSVTIQAGKTSAKIYIRAIQDFQVNPPDQTIIVTLGSSPDYILGDVIQGTAYVKDSGVIDTDSPTVPAGFTGTAASYAQVNLSWNASTDNVGVTGYELYRDGVSIQKVDGLTFQDKGLSGGSTYTYEITAFDALGNVSAKSASVSVTTPPPPDTTAPTVPMGLIAIAVSTSQIDLSWNTSTDNVGVQGYRIYRDGKWIRTLSDLSYENKGLIPNTTYTYQVAAYDAAGNKSGKSVLVSAMTQPIPPPPGGAKPEDFGFSYPKPEPALPSGVDPYNPPVFTTSSDMTAPGIAEMMRTGGPDETVTMAGVNFALGTTQFDLFSQTSASAASMKSVDPLSANVSAASVLLPANLPAWSMYMVWPNNKGVRGKPFAINRTDLWWVGPNEAVVGQPISVFGRNLSHGNGTSQSYVYIKPANSAGMYVTPTAVNPYKVDILVPSLAAGKYEVWVHNGHGGRFGWSGPVPLTVLGASPWAALSSRTYNVKSYGATGDGSMDDGAAVQSALNAASAHAPATLYFPSGTYLVNRIFQMPSNVRILGDGRDVSMLKLGVAKDRFFDANSVSNVMFENITIHGDNCAKLGSMLYFRGGKNVKIQNARLRCWNSQPLQVTADYLFFDHVEFTGDQSFYGAASQVFFNACDFLESRNAETATVSWGGHGLCFTGNNVYNADESRIDGHGIGRLFVAQGYWGNSSGTYFEGNTTHNCAPWNPKYADANKGEQILWEFGEFNNNGKASAVTATTVTVPGAKPESVVNGPYEMLVIGGRGVGQRRSVISSSNSTFTLDRPWDVIPDTTTSLFAVALVGEKSAIYNNTFEGRDSYDEWDSASTAVELYGPCYDIVADHNTISKMRHGLALMTYGHTTFYTPHFNLVVNNHISNSHNGIYTGTNKIGVISSGQSEVSGSIGNIFRNNTIINMEHIGIALDAWNGSPGGNQNSIVFEKNTVSNIPFGFITGDKLVWTHTYPFTATTSSGTRLIDIILRNNQFIKGTPPSTSYPYTSTGFRTDPQQIFLNLDTTFTGFQAGNVP